MCVCVCVCVKGVCEHSLHTLMHRKMHSIHDEVQAVKPFCFRLFHMLLNRQACTPHGVIARPNGAHGWSAGPARGSSGWWQAGFCPKWTSGRFAPARRPDRSRGNPGATWVVTPLWRGSSEAKLQPSHPRESGAKLQGPQMGYA